MSHLTAHATAHQRSERPVYTAVKIPLHQVLCIISAFVPSSQVFCEWNINTRLFPGHKGRFQIWPSGMDSAGLHRRSMDNAGLQRGLSRILKTACAEGSRKNTCSTCIIRLAIRNTPFSADNRACGMGFAEYVVVSNKCFHKWVGLVACESASRHIPLDQLQGNSCRSFCNNIQLSICRKRTSENTTHVRILCNPDDLFCVPYGPRSLFDLILNTQTGRDRRCMPGKLFPRSGRINLPPLLRPNSGAMT